MTREEMEKLKSFLKKNAIQPVDGKYNLLDLLSLPLSDTYKEVLRINHSEEWIEGLEEAIRRRKKDIK